MIFHVDGKSITHAPGTEDEFGSCWGFAGTFALPYCGYIHQDGGRNLMYRWYVVNPVRFRESLKVEVQDRRFENGQIPSHDDLTSVAFWYADGTRPAQACLRTRIALPSRAKRREGQVGCHAYAFGDAEDRGSLFWLSPLRDRISTQLSGLGKSLSQKWLSGDFGFRPKGAKVPSPGR